MRLLPPPLGTLPEGAAVRLLSFRLEFSEFPVDLHQCAHESFLSLLAELWHHRLWDWRLL